MDGIAGIVYADVFQVAQSIAPMLEIMATPGRALRDTQTLKNVQIGICGHALAANPQKTLFVALCGHIYNQNTSETIIAGYEAEGANFFKRLNGDFVFMLYDAQAEKLYLVRDRIGKKVLYWYQDENHFIFASDLKAMLASGLVPQSVARDSIAAYFYFGYIPQDMSPVQNVNKLLPGHYLEFLRSGTKFIHPYWSYSQHFKNIKMEKQAVVEQLDALLSTAVKERVQPVPTGCFISGGLGSAAIAYYLRSEAPDFTGYTMGFQGQNEEDMAAAEEVARTLNIAHVHDYLNPQSFLDPLVKVIWHLDEPLADPNIMATWGIAKLAVNRTESVFSGIGADELLAGHTRYTLHEKKMTPLERVSYALIPLLKWLWKPAAFSLLKQAKTNPSQFEYLTQNALFNERQMAQVFPKLKGQFDPEIFLHKFQGLFQFKSNVASYLYFDVKTRLADLYLAQYERLTSAQGLTLHTPFIDPRIVEFLASLFEPDDLPSSETAAYLKELLKGVYSDSFINRPKVKRPAFLQSWLKDPQLSEIFYLLQEGVLVENGYISRQWLRQNSASFQQLWSLLVLEIWYRLFINQAIMPKAPDLTVKELLK